MITHCSHRWCCCSAMRSCWSAAASRRRSRAARHADPSTEVSEHAGARVEAAALYELLSPSLFGGRRVIVIRPAQDLRAPAIEVLGDAARGAAIPRSPSCSTTPGWPRARRCSIWLASSTRHRIVCAKLTRAEERLDFVRGEVRRAGATITPEAAANLLDAVGSDLRELATVSAQLAADSGGRIDADTVAEYHRGRAEVSGFAVADLTVAGESGQGARGAALGAVGRRAAGGDRRCDRRRGPLGGQGPRGRPGQSERPGADARHAAVEGPPGPVAGARLGRRGLAPGADRRWPR